MATNENLPPNVIKQLVKELKSLDESPPEGIKVVVNDDDFSTIFADIEGPAGTPYENGIFRMKLVLSHDFPHSPPKGFFLTKIYHPNIATNGEICVNTLKKDWSPSHGLRHILIVIRCLLIEPFPESALNEQAGKMLLDDYEGYARHARLYTSIHAMKPKPKPKAHAISESTTALNVVEKKMPDTTTATTMPLSDNTSAATLSATGISNNSNSLEHNTVTSQKQVDENAATPAMPVKKEAVPTAAKVDKKKIDARKKSLKRL